jgi:FixJ family two-component response regulator
MAKDRCVHVISADANRCEALQRLLRSAGLTAVIYETADAVLKAAPKLRAGCLLVDLATPGVNSSTLQTELKSLGVSLPVIAAAPKGDVTTAVETMKAVQSISSKDQPMISVSSPRSKRHWSSRTTSRALVNRRRRRGGSRC